MKNIWEVSIFSTSWTRTKALSPLQLLLYAAYDWPCLWIQNSQISDAITHKGHNVDKTKSFHVSQDPDKRVDWMVHTIRLSHLSNTLLQYQYSFAVSVLIA